MTTMRKSAVLAAAFVGVFVGSARAQETIVVNVPFSFAVHGEQFPAGRYDVITKEQIVTIRGVDNRAGVFAIAIPADGRDPAGSLPALVFVRHENEYQLSQIWERSDEGFALTNAAASHRSKDKPTASAAPTAVIVAGAM